MGVSVQQTLMRALKMARIVELAEIRVVTVAELAEETELTERTIYRYVKAIRACGIQIRGEAGFGYRILKKGERNGAKSHLEIQAQAD
jgi:predicted DNA-binding transcriptional regulator YafY